MKSSFTAIGLAVAVRPGGADFEPGALLMAFLLDHRVHAMRRAVELDRAKAGMIKVLYWFTKNLN